MRVARVTVVVPCVCVCACVRACVRVCLLVVFCHHAHLDPEIYIGTYVFTATRKNFYNRDFSLKRFGSEATASFACLRCHQLHLNSKRRTPKEPAKGLKAIDSRDFNYKRFVQKLRYICLPSSCAYPQYKYA